MKNLKKVRLTLYSKMSWSANLASAKLWLVIILSVITGCAHTYPKAPIRPNFTFRGGFRPPLVVGHRGAAGYVPEHTLRSYKLALDLGADYIEPDLVMSKDGVLIVRHENDISKTTDIAQHREFKKRKTKKTIDGEVVTGWFTEDFTLNELKKLKMVERLPFRSHREDGLYSIVTFEEYLQFALEEMKTRKRTIGLIPEIKHSTYFHKLGFDPELKLVELLQKYGLNTNEAPVIIQSAEIENLKRLRTMTKVELLQLLDEPQLLPADSVASGHPIHFADMATAEGLNAIAEYADWVSPNKAYIFARDKDDKVAEPTVFVKEAHKAHLKVMPWTFRMEPQFLPKNIDGKTELRMNFDAQVDAVFTDFSDVAVAVRKEYWQSSH